MIQHWFRRCLHAVAHVAFAILWLAGLQAQAAENSITGLRLGGVDIDGSQALRVVIETSNTANAKLTLLTDPYRFVVDMPSTDWQVEGIAKSGSLSRERRPPTGSACPTRRPAAS
ncbi:MAG: hypothetical protein CM15mP115_09140 [Alphaproteobacteria bacterium]|nr:MAG: hypothetical protein CM15mP115_09140 [Alphaproteobacteria bacterium]